jgi:hypothetical protein
MGEFVVVAPAINSIPLSIQLLKSFLCCDFLVLGSHAHTSGLFESFVQSDCSRAFMDCAILVSCVVGCWYGYVGIYTSLQSPHR